MGDVSSAWLIHRAPLPCLPSVIFSITQLLSYWLFTNPAIFFHLQSGKQRRQAGTCLLLHCTWLAVNHKLFLFSSWVLSLPTEISPGIQNCFERWYFMMFTKLDWQCVGRACFAFSRCWKGSIQSVNTLFINCWHWYCILSHS